MAEAQLSVGEEKTWGNPFSCTGGVANGFSTSEDFTSGEFDRWCDQGYQKQEIKQVADNPGDVSIFRAFDAASSQTYRVTASCKLNGVSGDFRGRAKIAAWNGNQLQEWTVDNTDPAGGFATITRDSGALPTGTNKVKVNFRAHSHGSGAPYGVAVLEWLKFKRLS